MPNFALKILSLYSLRKVCFKIVKELFKKFEALRRSGKIQTDSTKEVLFFSRLSEKKVHSTLSGFALKDYLYAVQQKVFRNIVKDSFKSFEFLRRSEKISSRF